MYKRWHIYFALIFLFVFAQIGAITHEISHVEDLVKHSQQHKNTQTEQCEKCISFAKIAGGLPSQSFILPDLQASFIGSIQLANLVLTQPHTAYAARAPPTLS